MYDNCYNVDIKVTGFYKSDLLLIHGRLGKFTDIIDLSQATAGFHTQWTFSWPTIVTVGKIKRMVPNFF